MNPLQRASRNRKIIYLGVILALFTVSMVWRGMIPVPLGTSAASVAQPMRWAADHTIQSQAQRLEVWESDPNEGEAEITGSAARLALTGSRGFVVTGLWLSAIEKQKRNDFHEFEQRVQMVTKLQPNFITPWIFQSWNIAYNVSVEMQGPGDMYYYIVRGIQLLAEGERRNRRSPDMRYQIAFYYQNKFGVSDTVEVLRCLYDLSCIPPSSRDPDALTNPTTGEVDPGAFRQFCARHPHFVRRLRGDEARTGDPKRDREKLRADNPKAIVDFLRTHYKDLPARYRKDATDKWTDDLADADKQFPALPPQFSATEAHPGAASPDDAAPLVGYFSAFEAARAWFTYSLLLLPPPMKDGMLRGLPDDEGDPLPGPTPPPGVGGHDPSKHRVPRLPTMIIFRQGAPRAQTYCAELEQKEGWFDGEGWQIDNPTGDPDRWWFPDSPNPALRKRPLDVRVGTDRAWSLQEWQRAAEMWDQHGKANGLTLSDRQYANLQRMAGDASGASPDQADESNRRRYLASVALQYYANNRLTTNFPFFLATAQAEARVVNGLPLTVLARKTLWKADQARKLGNKDVAIRLYKDGLEQWKRVLADNPQFHRPSRASDRTEEETFEYELAYQRLLVQDDPRISDRANQLAHAMHGVVPFLTVPFPRGAAPGAPADPLWPEAGREDLKWWVVENVGGADFSSPFVGSLAADGTPWIRDEIRDAVRTRQGVSRQRNQPPPGPPPGAPTGGPPQPPRPPAG